MDPEQAAEDVRRVVMQTLLALGDTPDCQTMLQMALHALVVNKIAVGMSPQIRRFVFEMNQGALIGMPDQEREFANRLDSVLEEQISRLAFQNHQS